MIELRVRPEAEVDAFEAATWYEGEREGLGSAFLARARWVFERIETGAFQFPLVMTDVRRALLIWFKSVGGYKVVRIENQPPPR